MIKIDVNRLDESIGVIQHTCNGEVLEVMTELARVLAPERGTNELIDQALEDCLKYQNQFNETTQVLRNAITETGKLVEIDEYLKKLDISNVTSRSTSAATGNIDTDAVMM